MDARAVEALTLLPRPTDYIQVPVDLIASIGAHPAILLSRMHWRFEGGWRLLHEQDQHHWWEATLDDLSVETGLSKDQVRGALKRLVDMDIVVREKHRLGGESDQSYSYRLRTADEARSLLPTDVVDSPHGQNTDVVERPHRSGEITTSTSVKTSLNSLNADGVGDDDESVDNSGRFRLTEKRQRLITDAMVDSGQAHAVTGYLAYLGSLPWPTASDLIRRWCGIQAAARNAEGYRRADIDALLTDAGMPPTDDAAWAAMLGETAADIVGHGPHCRYDPQSGYCYRHGLRDPEPLPELQGALF